MAKKQIELTEIEAPYELPEGWKWVRFRDICNVYGRIGFRGYTKDDLVPEGEGAISLSPSNMKDMKLDFSNCTYISWEKYEESPEIMLEVGDVVIVKTASVGRTAYVDYLPEKTTLNPQIMVLKNISVNHKLVNYYLNTIYAVQMIQKLVNGTAIPTFSQEKFLNEPFPLPPTLEEQQRIVNRIEILFAKLDQAKEKAQNLVDTFETRKASILHKAFTGELTKKWREENGVGDDSWEIVHLENVIKKEKNALKAGPFGSALKKEFYVSDGYKIYGQEQVLNSDENFGDYYIDESKYKELESCKIAPNDVLISLVGTVGKTLILSEKCKPGIINPRLIKISLDRDIMQSKFFTYYFGSDYCRSKYMTVQHGTTMDVLNMGILKSLEYPCCTISEQSEIVRILDVILEKETKAKDAAEAVLEQIDLLKKSILVRAFRGEL